MAEKVYPSTKLNPPPAAATGPPKPPQPYNQPRPRPVYRPPQTRPSRSCSGRRCCCLTFLYTLIALLILLLLAAITACIFYLLYHPKHPTFSVNSIRTTRFNLTQPDSSGFAHLNSRFDFTLTAKNPNSKKITFVYEPMTLMLTSAGVESGNGSAPGFTHVAGNTTVLHMTVASDATRDLDSDSVSRLRSDLKKKVGFPVTVELDTMVHLEMGNVKTKKVGVRVTCDGIKGFQPKNATSKVGTLGTTSSAKCKVDLRIKIWKFTF